LLAPIPSAPAPGAGSCAAAVPRTTAPRTILIRENDLSIRKLLRRLLERRGYLVIENEEADHLANRLRNRRADLIVVDVMPAVEPGMKTLVELVTAHPGLKILALSSPGSAEHSESLPDRLLVLPKPFRLDSFVDCVDRLMEPSSPPNPAQ
jgi:DNA-binding NtrC family response regulator